MTKQTRQPLSPHAAFTSDSMPLDFSISDFWQWAYSDLQQGAIRARLAEFLVTRALGIKLDMAPAGSCELLNADNLLIEVKSACLQSGRQEDLSKTIFSGLCEQAGGSGSGAVRYRADICIFAVQNAERQGEVNQLELAAWEFYVLPKAALEKRTSRTMSLKTVQRLTKPVSYTELAVAVNGHR